MSEYEVYAIRYARNDARRSHENFIAQDAHDGPMPMDFYVWAVVGDGRSFVVDTGFNERSAQRRGRRVLRSVDQGLASIGMDCRTVEDVILTHMHWDHAGNIDLFPQARFHVQEREMHFCTGRCMCHAALRAPFEAEDVKSLVGSVFEGRVEFHDGSRDVADGLSVHWVGGHTMGLQVVRVRTRRGWVVLASDVAHYYANIERRNIFPLIYNHHDALEAFETVRRLSGSPVHVVPGHDPLVLDRYPRPRDEDPNVVRLDLDPST